MSAGPQLDGSDGGGELDGDAGGDVDAGRDGRVQDAVDEFQRSRLQAEIGSRSGFGQELGGDPAGDADRSAEQTSATETTARPSQNGEPTPDSGTESRPEPDTGGETDTTTSSAGETTARPDQGPAPSGRPDTTPSDDPGDTADESGGTEQVTLPGGREVVVNKQGRVIGTPEEVEERREAAGRRFAAASRRRARERGDLTADAADSRLQGPAVESGRTAIGTATIQQFEEDLIQERQQAIRQGLEGVGFFDEQAKQRQAQQEQIEQIEQQLERQVGEQRAATFGAIDQAQYRQIIERTDLERGEDFIIEAGEEETRTFTDPETGEEVTETVTPLEARLTEQFEREFLEEMAGFELAQRFGTEFEPGEDFNLEETDDGLTPELTGEGRAKAQTENLRRTVADFEAQVFGVGDTQFQFDIPGEGPLLTETDPDRDLGQTDIPVRMSPEDEFTTLEAVIEDTEEAILEATELQEAAVLADDGPARGRAGAALRTERRNFETGAGTTPVRQFSQSALRGIPLFATGAVGLGKDAADFGAAVVGSGDVQLDAGSGSVGVTFDEERINELFGNVGAAATEQAVLTAETVAEDPGEFGARALGTAVASLPAFGAARAIGPRASFLTRYGIQPGEELLGAGLNYGARGVGRIVGRPDAGRRVAETIAPNKEPVFFSEEAFIRGVRGVSRRTQNLLAEGRETLARVRVEPRVGAGIVPPKFELEGEGDTRFMEEELREAERAALNRRAEARAEERIKREREARRRRKPDSEPFVAERTSGREYNPDRPGGDFRGSQARRQGQKQRLRQRAAEQRRQKAQQRFTEVEEETLDRVQEAEAPTVDIEEDATPLGQMRRAETAIEGQVLDEAMARRVAAEASEIQELEQTGRVVGERPRTAIDSRLNELLETATDTEQRLDLDQRLELRTELEQRLEGRSELRSRIETRGEGDPVRQEVREEVEAEAETETKTETRIEQRQETRAEVNLGDGRFFEDEEELLDDWFGDETFGSGIAGEGEAALENIEQELVEGFEEGEAGTAELEDFEDAERDILEG